MTDVAERDLPTAFSKEASAEQRVEKGMKSTWWGCLIVANTGANKALHPYAFALGCGHTYQWTTRCALADALCNGRSGSVPTIPRNSVPFRSVPIRSAPFLGTAKLCSRHATHLDPFGSVM